MKLTFFFWLLGLSLWALPSLAEVQSASDDLTDQIRQALVDLEHESGSKQKKTDAEIKALLGKLTAFEKALEALKSGQLISENRLAELEAQIKRLKDGTIADPLRPNGVKIGCRYQETDYFISKDGGCKHKRTGYVYSQPSPIPRSWHDSYRYCIDLREGGYRDWTNPNAPELKTVAYRGGADEHFTFETDVDFWLAEKSMQTVTIKGKPHYLSSIQWMNVKTGKKGSAPANALAVPDLSEGPQLIDLDQGDYVYPTDHLKAGIFCVRHAKPE